MASSYSTRTRLWLGLSAGLIHFLTELFDENITMTTEWQYTAEAWMEPRSLNPSPFLGTLHQEVDLPKGCTALTAALCDLEVVIVHCFLFLSQASRLGLSVTSQGWAVPCLLQPVSSSTIGLQTQSHRKRGGGVLGCVPVMSFF